MRGNRHDIWMGFCQTYRDLLAGTELPQPVPHTEQRFRDLLELGRVTYRGAEFSLREMSPDAWAALYSFAAVFFRDFESFAPKDLFPAFRNEAERRGDKFPKV